MKRLLISQMVVVAIFLSACADKPPIVVPKEVFHSQPVTMAGLLDEMKDLQALTEFPTRPYSTAQFSSYNRRAKHPDDVKGWMSNGDRGYYLRKEEGAHGDEYVMFEDEGPGVVTRIWSANPTGTVRIYIDHEAEPVFAASFSKVLQGLVEPFIEPFGHEVGMGGNLYFPIPYQSQCKITVTSPELYYQINHRSFPVDTVVEPFSLERVAALQDQVQTVAGLLQNPDDLNKNHPESKVIPFRWDISADARTILRLKAHQPTVIQELRLKPSLKGPEFLRRTLLIMRFDGQETVRCPLGDFFGTGPGMNVYQSLPLSVRNDGTLVCRWVMPFQKEAEIELKGLSSLEGSVEAEILHDDYRWTDQSMRFHANWRSEYGLATKPRRDWNFITLEGQGLYVGNLMNIANPVTDWWGEGDEKIWVDDESFPSHFGTGTEDYYGYAWCCVKTFEHAYHNQTRCDTPGNFGHTSLNRWHVFDPIIYLKNLKFDMEVFHWDTETNLSYEVVNYWYSRKGPPNQQPVGEDWDYQVPSLPIIDRPPPKVLAGAVEGEDMRVLSDIGFPRPVNVSHHYEEYQWSGDEQLLWRDGQVGDQLELAFDAPQTGRYRVWAHLSHGKTYGVHTLSLNGDRQGEAINCYNEVRIMPAEPVLLGEFDLLDHDNRLRVDIVAKGRNRGRNKTLFGLDCLVLEPLD